MVFTKFELTWLNGFWFSLIFILTNFLFIKLSNNHFKKRVLKRTKNENKIFSFLEIINFFIFQFLIIHITFISINFSGSLFLPGLFIYLLSYIFYVLSLYTYSKNNPDKPVTNGIYKYSRNPQQIFTLIMWLGIGFMLNSLLIIILLFIQLFTMFPSFLSQEKFCTNKYGDNI